jgi:predicted lipoprotein with Yx(FWY)xxD motif
VGAGLLTATAAIHLDLYLTGYRTIPTIGWLFLLQVITAFALAAAVLVAPLLARSSWLAGAASAAAGAVFAVATLGGYLLSLWMGLFGFREVRTTAGVVAGVIEIAAFAALALLTVISIPADAPAAQASPPSTVPAGRNAPAGAAATTAPATTAPAASAATTAAAAASPAAAASAATTAASPPRDDTVHPPRTRAHPSRSPADLLRRADRLGGAGKLRAAAVPAVAGLAVVATAVLAISVATASGGSGGPATATRALLRTDSVNGVTVLTNSRGLTLYWFAPDTKTSSACYGTCASYWPPVYGTPSVASGVAGVTGTLGTIHRTDGTTQATYDGHPLYTYIGDTAPGQASGNDVNLNGGFWYEVRAA